MYVCNVCVPEGGELGKMEGEPLHDGGDTAATASLGLR